MLCLLVCVSFWLSADSPKAAKPLPGEEVAPGQRKNIRFCSLKLQTGHWPWQLTELCHSTGQYLTKLH